MEVYLKIIEEMSMFSKATIGLVVLVIVYKLLNKKSYENIKINFGKHYGKKYCELPIDYLEWLELNADKPLFAKKELERRKILENINKPELTKKSRNNMKKYGDDYEKKVGEYYKQKGYKINYRGLELGQEDGGIDLIAMKNNETLLIQCKYWKKDKSITHTMIKEFYGNCNFYMDKEKIETKNVICIYAIPNLKALSFPATQIFKNNYIKCRYNIIQ